jgi:hypothetical protein
MDSCLSSAAVRFPTSPLNQFTHGYTLRDIPLPLVSSGCENSGNLRELALQRMKDFGAECRDVRFREVGVCLFLLVTRMSDSNSPFRFMKSITKLDLNESNYFDETTVRTEGGRRSSLMKIQKRTFSLACYVYGSVPTKARSDQSSYGVLQKKVRKREEASAS